MKFSDVCLVLITSIQAPRPCHVMTGEHLWIYSSEEARETNAKETKPNSPLRIHKSSRNSCREFLHFLIGTSRAGTQFPQISGWGSDLNHQFSFSRCSVRS